MVVVVAVVVGEEIGVFVAEGVAVAPMEIGTLLHAVNTMENVSPKIVLRWFIACLYWLSGGVSIALKRHAVRILDTYCVIKNSKMGLNYFGACLRKYFK